MESRHKTALKTWTIVYPLITILIVLLDPFLQGLALPIRTFILSAIMVPMMVYLAHPMASIIAAAWRRR